MKRSSSWHDTFESEGHKLDASSDNEYVYLTVGGQTTKSGHCEAMTYQQLEALTNLLHEVIEKLKTEKRWDTKGKKKTNG